MRILLGLALACMLQLSQGFEWKNCGEGSWTVKSVILTPDRITPGCTAEFKIQADSDGELRQGSVNMIVTYAGLPIWTQKDDLCAKTACPVAKGPAEVVYQQPFPYITPPGHYTVTLKGVAGLTSLFCVSVEFDVVLPGGAAAEAGASGLRQAADKLLHGHRKELA